MPATPNLREEPLPSSGHRLCGWLEALESRALLSVTPAGAMSDTAVVAPVAASVPVSNPRAAAIAEAMKTLGLDPVPPASTSTINPSTTTGAPATAPKHSRKRRVKPLAVRAHHSSASTPVTPAPTATPTVPVILPTAPSTAEVVQAGDPGDQVFQAAELSSAKVVTPAVVTVSALARPAADDDSWPYRATIPAEVAASLQFSRGVSPFSATRIIETVAPVVMTELARVGKVASSVLSLTTRELPDWLVVGPQGEYVFSDRELFFKAGAMVLGIAGLVAGYCSYLQVTRARRQAQARARVEIYSLFGWQESL